MNKFPTTRFQGSKYKLKDWIKTELNNLTFNTFLDAFSGTSTISYVAKELNKEVWSNDIMKCNYYTSLALIKNNTTIINDNEIETLFVKKPTINYLNIIEENFKDIYFLEEENRWLDIVIQNILSCENEEKKAIFLWALFQSCLSKRPYNLFHRKNLHIRTQEVNRSFGNKTTWDKSFEIHFKNFIKEANKAIFNNNKTHKIYNEDILNLKLKPDLIYIDSPYIPSSGSITKYQDFYHFLNGLCDYYTWETQIDYSSKNNKIKSTYSIWEDKKNIINGFKNLIENYKNSIIIISYREDGIPSINELKKLLEDINKTVEIKKMPYNYALSKNKNINEILIIAK